jgi:hypothetical protein
LYPAEASLFAVSMLLFTEGGNTYTGAEITKWLKEAGFKRVELLKVKKETEDWEDGILVAVAPETRPGTTAPRIQLGGRSRAR